MSYLPVQCSVCGLSIATEYSVGVPRCDECSKYKRTKDWCSTSFDDLGGWPQPLWETVEEIAKMVPDEEWEKLGKDSSRNASDPYQHISDLETQLEDWKNKFQAVVTERNRFGFKLFEAQNQVFRLKRELAQTFLRSWDDEDLD